MALPFTTDEFLAVFADYNRAIRPLPLVAWLLGAAAACLPFTPWRGRHRALAAILALLWTVVGIGYHWLHFSAVTRLAWAYGALFLAQAALLAAIGTWRDRLRFIPGRGPAGVAGMLLVLYGLVAYPLLALLVTHPYPATPLFGVAPCPTVIFTIGLLLLAQPRAPVALAIVPLLWAAIGGSAALLLGVAEDYGLVAAGALLLAGLLLPARRRRPSEA